MGRNRIPHGETEINEEESRDRKQSGTERGEKEEEDKNAEKDQVKRGKKERGEEDEAPGGSSERLRSLPPEREEKKKERSKVRASGPDTNRFSRSRDTDEEEKDVGKEIKRFIFPPSVNICVEQKSLTREQIVLIAHSCTSY